MINQIIDNNSYLLKSNIFQNLHWHTFSSYFPPTFEFLKSSLLYFWQSKCVLIKPMGYRISFNLNGIILMASFLQNLNFKIQTLAGNSLKICVSVGFEISLTLVGYQMVEYLINIWSTSDIQRGRLNANFGVLKIKISVAFSIAMLIFVYQS